MEFSVITVNPRISHITDILQTEEKSDFTDWEKKIISEIEVEKTIKLNVLIYFQIS